MKESTEKEYLNTWNTVGNALRTEVEHVKTEVEHDEDFLTMAVNTAKSWWSW